MKFTTTAHGAVLLRELKNAAKASIAVGFFNPDKAELLALGKIPKLRLLVSDDFQFNNPYKLESLCRRGVFIRAVRAESTIGKLHSKVYVIERQDGSRWAMVGSANLTRSGLYANQEACVVFDSRQHGDDVHLAQINGWLDEICDEVHPEIDFEVAKAVYETRAKYSAIPAGSRNASVHSPQEATGYWALKPGYRGECWQNFLAEDVIAIGWNAIRGNPSAMSAEEAEKAYRASYPDAPQQSIKINVPQILNFVQSIEVGDLVLICGRFDGINKSNDVFIYGIARMRSVDGRCYFDDKKSDWYRFKRHATIQRIEESVSRKKLASALGKASFVPTILTLNGQAFKRLASVLRAELGVAVTV